MDTPTLSKSEQAYFDSRGAAEIVEDKPGPEAEAPEPVSRPDPEPAATEKPEPTDDAPEQDDRRVPLAALHEERARRKELSDKLAAAEAKQAADMARFEERMAAMQAAFQPQQPQQPAQMPDPTVDPLAYVQSVGQTAVQTQQQMQEFMQRQEAQQREAQVRGWAAAEEQKFIAEKAPDYYDAVKFLVESRAGELAAMGLPQDQINRTLMMEKDNMLVHAVQTNQNPAELAYKVAQTRGFKRPEPAAAAAPVEDASARVETIERGQRLAVKVPSNGASPSGMTVERLLEMPAGEFDAWISRHPKQWKALAGE